MSVKNFQVESFDGLNLCSRTWFPPANVGTRARVLFLHGFGEFLDNFNEWFELVTAGGYEVTMYDQRGHGSTAESPKDFGKSNEAGIMGDLETMVNYMLENDEGRNLPLVLWGFSMGGANCLNYMAIGKNKAKIDLYIAVSPYLSTHPDTNKGLNAAKLWILPYISKIFPGYTDSATLKPEIANNNPEKWELYRKQPLRHTRTTAEFMMDAINRGSRLQDPEFVTNIVDKPLLLCHGTGDQICDVDGSKRFFELAKLTDKTLDLYPGLPHELMQCIEKDRLEHWKHVHEWLDAHTAAQSAQTASHNPPVTQDPARSDEGAAN